MCEFCAVNKSTPVTEEICEKAEGQATTVSKNCWNLVQDIKDCHVTLDTLRNGLNQLLWDTSREGTYRGGGLKHSKFPAQMLIQFQDCCNITAPVPIHHLMLVKTQHELIQIWNFGNRFGKTEAPADESPVAVIWSWPYCDNLVVKHPFVSLHNQLMCPADGLYFISVIKCCGYIATE